MMPMLWNITLQELVLVTDRQIDRQTKKQKDRAVASTALANKCATAGKVMKNAAVQHSNIP